MPILPSAPTSIDAHPAASAATPRRDYFAAAALHALLGSRPDRTAAFDNPTALAHRAFALADAMLAASAREAA